MFRAVLAAGLLGVSAAAVAAPADDLEGVIDAHWRWALDNDPALATQVGDRRGDGKLGDPSLAAVRRRGVEAAAFVARLDAVPDAGLSEAQRVDKAVLRRLLSDDVEAARFPQAAINFTSYSAWHQGFRGLADRSPFRTRADYESYVRRLEAYPAYNDAEIAVMRTALATGQVQPCAPLANFEASVTALVAPSAEASAWWRPFAGARPAALADGEWEALRARARRAIEGGVVPAYAKLAQVWRAEYLPRCRADVGASGLPQGREWYASRVRYYTTTDMTPDQVHELGLGEVARIGAAMQAVAREAGYADRAAMVAALRADPKYYARSESELLAAAAWQAKRIDGLMPRWFGRLPRLPYGVAPIPAEIAPGTTTAYYEQGSPAVGRAGTYRVNTSKLDERPLFELPALTAHEAVPGHHHQIALQQELDLPPFRRELTYFTAFVEGWALYAERVGEEMGLYDTPEKKMGRLSYEMWRACRLVVDTGMHAKGWDKARAVRFMTDNTALSAANIDAEVNRYISWPGQALAYKVGELRIVALRGEAEAALGPRFDVRRFHDAVLANGPVPLDVLEREVRAWIAREAARPAEG